MPRQAVERVGSWARFRELYGRGTARVMPEAQQAFQNGIFELVVVDLPSAVATAASSTLDVGGSDYLSFRARAAGPRPNGLEVVLTTQGSSCELRLREGGEDIEVYRNLSVLPGDASYIGSVLVANDSEIELDAPTVEFEDFSGGASVAAGASQLVATVAGQATVTVAVATGASSSLDITEVDIDGTDYIRFSYDGSTLFDLPNDPANAAPFGGFRSALQSSADISVTLALPETAGTLAGGVDASTAEYVDALTLLEDVAEVDLVSVALQDHGDVANDRATTIYSAVISHCEQMSANAMGRVGFGQVSPAAPGSAGMADVDLLDTEMANLLRSDRFVLLAPHGALGATVGRVGGLAYYLSPTFKTLAGLGDFRPALRVEQQREYLRQSMVPIAAIPGRGIAIVRGLTTDGDQINVRRIADRAVRGVRLIGELFIGKLNTEDGRNALKQKLTELLLQMQSENAIVPSTDGSDPAFKLDVYSTQADFAQGIVRVDLAVRPVRAIDFIYATVLVQV
ncbi:MAG: phage tail sheath C-terminal domain-containing protein [Nannocystaceae bacterium]